MSYDRRSSVGVVIAACGLGAIVLTAYVLTLAPGLLINDSGEFQTLAYTLGHTHPTGYPIYLLLAKVATWLPVNDIAYRVNLFSALSGVVVAIELFLLAKILTDRTWLPWVASFALAASPTFWSQAIIAEVYIPAAAFLLGVLLCLALWQVQGRAMWVFFAGVLGGMSLGVHLSVALSAPAAVIFVALHRPGRKRNLMAACAGALTGTLVTLAAFGLIDRNRLPSDYFRAVVEPSRSEWDLTTEEIDRFWSRLAFSLSARQYSDNLQQPSRADVQTQVGDYLRNLPREIPPLILLAAGVGIVQLSIRNWRYALLLLVSLATHLAYLVTHDMGDIHVAYIPTYLVLTMFATAALGVRQGVLNCGSNATADRPNKQGNLQTRTSGEGAVRHRAGAFRWEPWLAAVLLISVLLPAFQKGAWTPEGRRARWSAEGEPFRVAYSEEFKQDLTDLVNDLEDDAVLFTGWDVLYACYYVAHVEQQRTKMRFVQVFPAIGQRELADSAREFIRRKLPAHPIYLLEPLPELADDVVFEPVQRGKWTLFRLHPRSGVVSPDDEACSKSLLKFRSSKS